jgi:hypothetical protein
MDIKAALDLFEAAAIKNAAATEEGNYRVGNKEYDKISKAVAFLKEQNQLESLSGLLTNDSVGVRLWAASYLLPIFEEKALLVLQEISDGTGILSFDAKMTLSEWKKQSKP